MDNSGKPLEALVKIIEEVILPIGFKISVREKVFDDGVQVAELDIVVRGNSSVWLIECRDRPSEGASPVSWIEQLVGRRQRLKFDEVIAVSTTGFAPGAIKFANEANIEVRTISEISKESIASWFNAKMKYNIFHSELLNAKLVVDHSVSQKQLDEISLLLSQNPLTAPILIHTGSRNLFSVNDAWEIFIRQNSQLFKEIKPGGAPQRIVPLVTYTNPNSMFKIKLSDSEVDIKQIVFEGNLSIIVQENVPIEKITEYSSLKEKSTIAQSIHYDLKLGNEKFDVAIHKVSGQKGDHLLITSSPLSIKKSKQ